MRILYGVAGEGMGHATRSHAFLADLVGEHDVLVVASGRAHDYLAQHFPQVREILGFSLAYEDNAIRRWETVAQNLRGAVSGWPAQVRSFYEVARDFEPDVVVSDFEAFVLTVARRERVPAISVDNIMMLDRCRHDEGIVGGDTLDFELARQIARTKAAGLHWAIVPTFFRPPLRRAATTLVAPVLREAVLAAEAEQGEHLLVYQTAAGSETLVRTLHETGLPCRLYGVRRDLEEDLVDGELVFRPFSETVLPRRPAHGARRHRRRRLLAALRVRVPAQAGALDPRRRPVRADAERALPRAARLRRVRGVAVGGGRRRLPRAPAGPPAPARRLRAGRQPRGARRAARAARAGRARARRPPRARVRRSSVRPQRRTGARRPAEAPA